MFMRKRYFQCDKNKGLFTRPNTLKRFTPAMAAAVATFQQSGGPSSSSRLHKAATRIQSLIRGAQMRTKQKDKRLWDAFNELDWKEESELMESHKQYEDLKKKVEEKRDPNGKDAASAGAEAGARADEAAAPRPAVAVPLSPKKEARKSMKKQKATAMELALAEDGVLLNPGDPITLDYVTSVMDYFKSAPKPGEDEHILPAGQVAEILKRVTPILKAEQNVVELEIKSRCLPI